MPDWPGRIRSGDGPVVGAVLCGGASRRMGRDKALIEVDGQALAARVAAALRAGGCGEVLAVGGDHAALAGLGLLPVADRWPSEGPLGGLATALAAALTTDPGSVLVIAPCDLVRPSSTSTVALLDALAAAEPAVDGAVPLVDGRPQWIHSAWRAEPGLAASVAGLVERGARRLSTVGEVTTVVAVGGVGPSALLDADVPADLERPQP
ncbi:molybdenum cofactor guanylyltransferase [Iamia sp.]|uniref:molybdenum cofactor guanylyltransferase n=1 Tax=Iamia sp. TaxID=2722710 RepID=UPI002CF6AACC|nr:NTP transferase domain-containing protein [Iamia sp.]HXH59691.1 NTP transferase domain-containing protein [Iamia sp.]